MDIRVDTRFVGQPGALFRLIVGRPIPWGLSVHDATRLRDELDAALVLHARTLRRRTGVRVVSRKEG